MEKETTTPQPVCAEAALALLNCVSESNFDREKCARLIDSLRNCVVEKKVKKFSLSGQQNHEEGRSSKAKQ